MKTRSRYFSAENRAAAETMAEDYFVTNIESLVTEDISGGGDTGMPLQIIAFNGRKSEFDNMKGDFCIIYDSDGVYLEIFKERGAGEPLDRAAAAAYIRRKNITGIDDNAYKTVVVGNAGRTKIAPPQQESFVGEDISVEISKDESEARIMLLAPEPGGAAIDIAAAKQKIIDAGVVHGLDEQALEEFLARRDYRDSCVVATATPPIDGADGKLIYHFNKDERTARPKEIDGGRVDYKSLDLFEPVSKDQVLVERVLATEGTPGTTVKGRPLKQKHGKDTTMPKGKNVNINAEKTEMSAINSGMVELIKGIVTVSNMYNIEGDVGPAIGNIDFDGSVNVSGNVMAGYSVKASGGVVIGGVVEAAEVIAGGSVEVKRGMQGMDKGRIEAGGAISMLYIERGTAIAGGSVTVDACIHSVIEAGGGLYAKGKRGGIIGGRVSAATEVIANTIGSVSQTQTEVEVGGMPQKRERIAFIEKDTERLDGELIKLDQLDAYLQKTKEKLDPATWDKLYLSGIENRRIYKELLEEYAVESVSLQNELEHATEGKVHVFDTAYRGARIVISSDTYRVNDDIQYATFKYRDGQVVYVPCEIRKND
ncbi:MAG: FapA family protein [Oscillospiraceae bacterium]|nr:FapA family protein [Oscillospiraceae bacterium]MCL2126119.1 FapA family protein [Oscillospiraceae bacterium]